MSSPPDEDTDENVSGKATEGASKKRGLSIDELGYVTKGTESTLRTTVGASLIAEYRASQEQQRWERQRLIDSIRMPPSPAIETARASADTAKASNETARATRALADGARVSTILSGIAVGVAVLALVASLAAYRLAFMDDEGDRQWRREQQKAAAEQLRALEQIRDRLPSVPADAE